MELAKLSFGPMAGAEGWRGMGNVLEQSEVGREIARRNWERGFAAGFKQGLAGGMRVILRTKYGDLDDLDDLAQRLFERDHDGSIARIVAGATVEELRS